MVTHGTDTMADTARALLAAGLPKTVVLTGAMIPYAFGSSDGLFNLGSALSFAQVLPHGVWVAMNGRVFPGDRVRKNRATGMFEDDAVTARRARGSARGGPGRGVGAGAPRLEAQPDRAARPACHLRGASQELVAAHGAGRAHDARCLGSSSRTTRASRGSTNR